MYSSLFSRLLKLDTNVDGAYPVFSSVVRVRPEKDTATSEKEVSEYREKGMGNFIDRNSLKTRFSSGRLGVWDLAACE